MQVIIIGCGKVGARLAKVMYEKGHDVVIVDKDSRYFDRLGPEFDGVTVTGVPIDQDVLKQAGIETADALVAVTPDDNTNIMVCQVAKEIFRVPKVIARIYSPEREGIFQEFGLETICPTNITVDFICSMVFKENEVSTHTIGKDLIAFRSYRIESEGDIKKINQSGTMGNTLLFGIIRDGKFLFPNGSTKIARGDIAIMAEKTD